MQLDNNSKRLIEELKPVVENILKERPYHIPDLVEMVARLDCDDFIMQNIIAYLEYEKKVLFLGFGKGYMIFQTLCGPVKHRVELSVYCSPEFMENLKINIFNALQERDLTKPELHDLLNKLDEDTYFLAMEMIISIIVNQLKEENSVERCRTKIISNVPRSAYYRSRKHNVVQVDVFKAI